MLVALENSAGIPVQDIWLDMKDAHNQNIHITGYPTEKNPDMLERIIEASSNPGDLVLDCYAGSGTTLASAASLGDAGSGLTVAMRPSKPCCAVLKWVRNVWEIL